MPQVLFPQSDMDQSASEVDDNISPHLDRVTKDQLYSTYRKVQAKYHKYRGRYTDLATHYRELDKVKSKLECVLVETQDKVLRRITDLKEQCQLEQQAKAHLEEALRNDIEEKDHIISTLNTKVKLLQASGPTLENAAPEDARPNEGSKGNLIDLSGEQSGDENSALSAENSQLKDKLKKLEALVLRYKESLKRNKEKFTEVTKEKNILENEHEALKNSTAERMGTLESDLSVARAEIENLTEQVDTLQRREEESAISLAENKLSVHRELEEKEEQIKQLRMDLKRTTEEKENLNEGITEYKAELSKLKSTHVQSSTDKDTAVQDTSREVSVTQQSEMNTGYEETKEAADDDKEAGGSDSNENTPDELTLRLKEKESELQETRCKLDELEKQWSEYRNEKESIRAELSAYKTTCTELRNEYNAQKLVMEERRRDADATIEKLQATVQSVDKELENMRNALIDRDHVCENYNKKVQQYAAMFEQAKHKLTEQEAQMRLLEDRLEDKLKLTKTHEEDLETKRTELNALQAELDVCRSTMDDLRNKVQADSSIISLLKKERSDLTNRLVHYNDCVRRLRQDYVNVSSTVKEDFSSQKTMISDLYVTLGASLAKFEQENVTLKHEVDELRSKLRNSEQITSAETTKLRSELDQMEGLESTLQAELRRSSELDATNNKLIAEIDNLNFKIHDLGKASHDLIQSQRQVRDLQERLEVLEDLETANRALSSEIGELREKHARAIGDMDRLGAKLHEATDVIDSLRSENDDQDALREQLRVSKSEIARLKTDLGEKEGEIQSRDEKLACEKEHVARLKSTCDSHTQTIEEHVQKYLNLEAEYQATRESHAKEIAGLMESNKVLQETVNVKLVQLKKMKIIKERQSKTIEDRSAELNDLKSKHTELSNTLAICEKQIESLKSENAQLTKITLENKDLKDKHNDLLSRNERLRENEESLVRKIDDYERDAEELRKIARDHAESCKSRQVETERLSSELATSNEQLERKSVEMSSLKERLFTCENELREIRENLDEWNMERRSNSIDTVETRDCANDEPLVARLRKLLQEQIARMKSMDDQNTKLTAELHDLIRQNSDLMTTRTENDILAAQQATLTDRIVELEGISSSNSELQTRVSDLQSKISSLEAENDGLQSEVNALQSVRDSCKELSALKCLLTEKEAAIKLLEDENSNASLALSEEKIADLQLQIDSLARTNDALRKELEVAHNDTEDRFDEDKLREENKRLEAQLDETLITFQAKETQMQLISNELKAQANQLREQLRINEEEQGMRLKQLVKEFQAQLHDKEEELQAALEKRFGKVQYISEEINIQLSRVVSHTTIGYLIFIPDRQHNYESNLVQQYKEQLKDCQTELSERSEQLESLVLENKDTVAEKGKDIDRLVETITRIKQEHADEVKELEKKWKAIVQQRIDNLQSKHEDELNELTKEWQNERKVKSLSSRT